MTVESVHRTRGVLAARALAIVFCLSAFALVADTLDLRSGNDVCKVDVEHGARIVSWTVGGKEMLWNPSAPQKDDGKWRHGGIPLVWPWQCDEYPDGVTNGPLHGVAWQCPFKVESRMKTDRGEELSLSLEIDGLRADYTVSIRREGLRFSFKTTNIGSTPRKFAMSIHPYFYLPERNRAVVGGLDGLRYRDTRDGFATNGVWKGLMPITAWTDHEFPRGGGSLGAIVYESEGCARLLVRSDDATAFWVWNPGERWVDHGAQLFGELPDDAWRHILSIEPSTAGMRDAAPLRPGESRTLTAEIARVHSL